MSDQKDNLVIAKVAIAPDRQFISMLFFLSTNLINRFHSSLLSNLISLCTTLICDDGKLPKLLEFGRKWLIIPDKLKSTPEGGVMPVIFRKHIVLSFAEGRSL